MASDRLISKELKEKGLFKGSCLPVTVEECSENVLLVNLKHGIKEFKGVLLETNTRLDQYGINLQRINSFSQNQVIEAKTTPCTTERFTYKCDGQPSALTVFSQNPIKRDRKPHHLSRILRPRRFICRKCKKLYLLDEDANGNSCNDDGESGILKNSSLRDDQSTESSKSKRKRYPDNDDDSIENGYDKETSQTIVHVTPSIIPKLSPKFPGLNKSDKTVDRLSYSPTVSRRNSSDSLSSKSNGGSKKRKHDSSSSRHKEHKKSKKSLSSLPSNKKSSSIPSNSTSKVPIKKIKTDSSPKKLSHSENDAIQKDEKVSHKPKKVALIDFDELTHQKPNKNKSKSTTSLTSKSVKHTQKEVSSSKTVSSNSGNAKEEKITDVTNQENLKISPVTNIPSVAEEICSTKTQEISKTEKLISPKRENSSSKIKSNSKILKKKKTRKESQSISDNDSQSNKTENLLSGIYEFTDDSISTDSKTISNKKTEHEKPKNRWMREEKMRRYQETRTSSIKNLREERPKRTSSLGSSPSKSETTSPKRLSQTKKSGGIVGIKINRRREGSGSTESYKVQLLDKPEPSSPKPDLLQIDVSSPAESVISMCNGIKPPKVSKKMSTCKASIGAKAMGSIPKDVDKQSSVSDCNLDNGCSFQVNDVVWAKITGYPFWPCKIVNITFNGKKCSGCSYTACVSWYAWDQVSYISCDKLLHFQQHYNAKLIKSKKGAYKLAVDQAWLESQNRSLLDEQETTDNSSPKTDISTSHPVIARATRSNVNASVSELEGGMNEPLTQICDDLPDLGPDAINDNEIPSTHIPTFSDDEFEDEREHLMIDPEKLLS